MHSKYFDKIKGFYDSGLWSKNRVRDAVYKGLITETEFVEIVGLKY